MPVPCKWIMKIIKDVAKNGHNNSKISSSRALWLICSCKSAAKGERVINRTEDCSRRQAALSLCVSLGTAAQPSPVLCCHALANAGRGTIGPPYPQPSSFPGATTFLSLNHVASVFPLSSAEMNKTRFGFPGQAAFAVLLSFVCKDQQGWLRRGFLGLLTEARSSGYEEGTLPLWLLLLGQHEFGMD